MRLDQILFNKFFLMLKNYCQNILNKFLLNLNFYINFFLMETFSISLYYFFWKSANFSDSYWFLYNNKLQQYDVNLLK
mgnify:CR=1 FL=1